MKSNNQYKRTIPIKRLPPVLVIPKLRNPQTPPEYLSTAARHPQYRMTIAQSPQCPPDLLSRLSNDPTYRVRRSVFENLQCSTDIIKQYLAQQNTKTAAQRPILWAIAKHPNCTADTLKLLAKDTTDTVLQTNIINRLDCPSDALNYLTPNVSHELRRRIALHRNATTVLLVSLAKDKSIGVRVALAQRDPLPSAVAISLLNSDTTHVVQRVLNNQSVEAGVLALFSLSR